MAVIGIVMVSVTPRFGERTAKGDPQISFFKELLEEHLRYAKGEGVPIAIVGFKGSANLIKYDGVRVAIPAVKSIQTVKINGEFTEGIEYHINVYPDGVCDYFELETDKKALFYSKPVLLTVRKGVVK